MRNRGRPNGVGGDFLHRKPSFEVQPSLFPLVDAGNLDSYLNTMKINALNVWKTVCLLALMAAAAQAAAGAARPEKSYTGIVNYIDSTEHVIDLHGALFDKRFNLSPACTCLIPNHDPGRISDLEQHPMQFDGMVDDVNSTNHTVTAYCRRLDRTFNLAAHCQIILKNHQPGGFTNLQNGDQVLVTFETPDGTPTAQRIEQTSLYFAGTLKAVDLTEGTLKARAGFSLKKFTVAKNCAILIHGRTAPLSDFKPNDKLVLTYDVIKGVNAVSRIVPAEEATNVVETDEYKVDL